MINLGKTWEKIVLAARIIVAIEVSFSLKFLFSVVAVFFAIFFFNFQNVKDIVLVSARPWGIYLFLLLVFISFIFTQIL